MLVFPIWSISSCSGLLSFLFRCHWNSSEANRSRASRRTGTQAPILPYSMYPRPPPMTRPPDSVHQSMPVTGDTITKSAIQAKVFVRDSDCAFELRADRVRFHRCSEFGIHAAHHRQFCVAPLSVPYSCALRLRKVGRTNPLLVVELNTYLTACACTILLLHLHSIRSSYQSSILL